MAHIYKEITDDRGWRQTARARDNCADYILTSAHAHDLRSAYVEKYNRQPSARWYHRHFTFERVK